LNYVDEQGIYFPLLGISELKLYAGNKVFQKGYAILIITNLMPFKTICNSMDTKISLLPLEWHVDIIF
jgi:hypothetical protein